MNERVLIKDARVLTMTEKGVIERGDILLEEGRIRAVEQHIECPEAEVVEARGFWATPGLIDPHCHIGMEEEIIGYPGDDLNEVTDPLTPQLRALDAVNPREGCFAEALAHGVTTVVTGPGSANVLGGTFVALKTGGERVDDMVIREVALKAALGENPKRVYGEQKRTPRTRMATAALLRQALIDAKKNEKPDSLATKAVRRVLEGELPLKVHCHRLDDILTALRIAREFEIRITLEHCTEGYLMPEVLREAEVSVAIGPLITDRCKPEMERLSYEAPRKLWEAGVPFALMTDHPVIPAYLLPVEAALATRYGLPDLVALEAITRRAAEHNGIADRVGALSPGLDGDVVLFDGDPLAVKTRVRRVYVGGNLAYAGASAC